MKKLHFVLWVCLGVLGFCSGCATTQRGAIMRAQSGIEKGKYEFSLRRLSEAEHFKQPTPAVGAEIAYLKGVCFAALNKPDEATAMFKFVADHFPDTAYGYMTKEKLSELQKK